MLSRGSVRANLLVLGIFSIAGCNSPDGLSPSPLPESPLSPTFAWTLTGYFPPSEANGGWRIVTDSDQVRSLGMSPSRLDDLGAYSMSLPWQNFTTGVQGYDPSNKAALVIKNGWIVGEYYNKSSARTAVYYLASNGKSFAMMLLGRLQLDYPGLGIGLGSRLYDRRWLPQGFPLTDPRKADITLDHLLRHVSGIVPEAQAPIAAVSVSYDPAWNFAPFTVGKDADFPVSAPLYFRPGDRSTYSKDPYSSVAFNHLSLLFRNVTGLEAGTYLRRRILDPIGVGRMAYMTSQGMGSYVWATGGNGLASARDYARLAYLLLNEGDWAGKQIFSSTWIRRFTTTAGYPNMNSNADCRWGGQYPSDMYRIIGSGVNLAWIVPSLDLVATLNGRTPNTLRDEVSRTFLEKLFASVTQSYVTCDGRTMNDSTLQTSQSVTALTLMNADTDQPILTLTNGTTLTLADLPTRNLNVRAETSPSTVGSVRFGLDANANFRTETNPPYALAGDDAGNYRPWTPAVGAHTIKATPYAGASGSGTEGISLSLGFTVK